ncbi:Gfo/Idh/MocA family oxidoreductase [soil metagenome]
MPAFYTYTVRMANQASRRDILKGTAALAAGLAFQPGLALGRPSSPKKADKLRFGVIGVSGRGGANLDSAAQMGTIVALCDVDMERLGKALIDHKGAAAFPDFRMMLEKMQHEIDAVVVSTPDHCHAPAAALAMRMGKPVYCEKPLTKSISEARKLAEIARSKKVVTQMGNQGTAGSSLRKTAALIQKGTFGAVKEVHCWTDRASGWWPQGVERPAAAVTPKTLEWDLWLGPSPFRPYAPGYAPFAWRGWWDFGAGALGDIGCHCMNLPFMALDLRDPIAVTAKTSGHNRDSYPSWSEIKYEFAKRGSREALDLYWYDGGHKPSQDIAPGMTFEGNGCLIVCANATVFSSDTYGANSSIVGGGALPDIQIEESPGHFQEFVQAIQNGGRAKADFADYSGALTETVLLGNLAVWADGPRLEWDARKMAVKGHPEYDVLIHPVYRPGYEL